MVKVKEVKHSDDEVSSSSGDEDQMAEESGEFDDLDMLHPFEDGAEEGEEEYDEESGEFEMGDEEGEMEFV